MTDTLTGIDIPVMDRSQTFWAFAHQVYAYTVDPQKSLTMLIDQHAKHFPDADPAAAEVRLRGILGLSA